MTVLNIWEVREQRGLGVSIKGSGWRINRRFPPVSGERRTGLCAAPARALVWPGGGVPGGGAARAPL